MFSGIISNIGLISAIEINGPSKSFEIGASFGGAIPCRGESIAVNGVCVTVTNASAKHFCFFASPETLEVTNFKKLKVSDKVNLERSLSFGDRVSGHFVSGHVDGMGEITERKFLGDACLLKVQIPSAFCRWAIPKGSIAVDGVSLTINEIKGDVISLTIIPETQNQTIFSSYQIGSFVNIECDQIVKAVVVSTERLQQHL